MQKNKIKFCFKARNTFFLLLIITGLITANSSLTAQTATSSPYSRYGLGDINSKGFGQSFSMGGTTIAMQNDSMPIFFINTANPASYVGNRLTIAELGINFTRLELQSSTAKQVINAASLGYLALAFPIKRWWGASFGLVPYSSVGYKVTDHQEIANVGAVDFLYEGSGGVSQLYFGNAFKPLFGLPRLFTKSKRYKLLASKTNSDNTLKSDSLLRSDKYKIAQILKHKRSFQPLQVGCNVSYLFGNIDHTRRAIFPSNSGDYNTRTGTTSHLSDVYMDYGVQYSHTLDSIHGRDLKDKVKLLIGATFAAQTSVRAKIDSLSYTYYTAQGYERIRDTIENTQGSKGKIVLPLSFGVGIGFKKGERWVVGADFAMQNWSSYEAFNQSGGLKNSMRVSVGAQWIPNYKALQKKYFARLNYRLGARYAQTALELKTTQLTETAVSAGIGFPVGRNFMLQNFSMINIGVEMGQRGTTNNGLIKENFVNATIGFTINDRWFVKPKYD